MGLMDTMVEKYPKYTIAILFLYSLLITGTSVVSFFYTSYYEAKKPYLTAVFTYCEEVSDTVARIRSASAFPQKSIDDFWAYYFGKLVIVEDQNLSSKMVAFGNILNEVNKANYTDKKKMLHSPALAVSGACRDLIKQTWSLSIVPWKDVQKP